MCVCVCACVCECVCYLCLEAVPGVCEPLVTLQAIVWHPRLQTDHIRALHLWLITHTQFDKKIIFILTNLLGENTEYLCEHLFSSLRIFIFSLSRINTLVIKKRFFLKLNYLLEREKHIEKTRGGSPGNKENELQIFII